MCCQQLLARPKSFRGKIFEYYLSNVKRFLIFLADLSYKIDNSNRQSNCEKKLHVAIYKQLMKVRIFNSKLYSINIRTLYLQIN